MSQFINQVAIITGGTRGIGRSLSEAFLQKGASVIAIYHNNQNAAEEFLEHNSLYRDKITLKRMDVTNASDVKSFFEELESKNISAQILVNNSGIRQDNIMASMTENEWDSVINTNLKSTYLMGKEAVLHFLKNRYGRIINISSVGGKLCLSGQTNYAASKAGQIALTKSLAKEVAKKGITVNAICPGFIETDMTKTLSPELKKEFTKDIPMKRFGKPEEVAAAVMFLASAEAAYITGATLDISGGL